MRQRSGTAKPPAEQRQEAVVDLVATMLEAACETVDSVERAALLEKTRSRIEAMKKV